MWMRKTDENNGKERKRYWLSFEGPGRLFAIVFFFTCLSEIIGNSRGDGGSAYWPGTWRVIPRAVVGGILLGAIAAIVGYILQLVLGRKILAGAKTMICNTCYRAKRQDREDRCECGGEFEDFDNWTWVDD
jgi:hypothetical protein